MPTLDQTFARLESLQIQGATAVARAIVLALKDRGLKSELKSRGSWQAEQKSVADYLLSARPTEPMAQNLCRLLLAIIADAKTVAEGQASLKTATGDLLELITEGSQEIVNFGQKIIADGEIIFTHCHSSTVEKIIVGSQQAGKKITVYNTETRPLFQGRITAANLLKAGVPVTMVADSAAGFLISPYSTEKITPTKVLLGADVIFSNGSAVNKIGSFEVALAAHTFGVPVYIVAHLLKTDDDGKIEMEKRPAKEIWPGAPKGLEIINFAFDLIPAKYITGFITEFGVTRPRKIKKLVKKKYPWILRT
ncbi:MAG: translation initiation factor eIF-2B [Patescibacteria group bacterium]|jgi:ribose 1,5-bisphosphate isomerase